MKSLSQAEYGEIRDLYQSIYAPKEVEEEFELSHESLVEATEEVVFGLIDEGYDIEDIDEMFDDELIEEIIDEARVTMGRGDSAGVGKVTIGSGTRMKAKSRLDKRKAEKRAETVRKTKKAVRDVIDKPAREYAAKRKIVPSKSGKQKLNISNLEAKQRTSAGRREIRGRVAKDIASRAKKTVGNAVRGAVASVKMKPGDPDKSIKSRIGKARSGLKGMIGKAARNVANRADKAASRLGEEVETYDVVVEFLCDQGIAENLQEAQWMMVNEVDSEDIATILEAYGLDESRGADLRAKHGDNPSKKLETKASGKAMSYNNRDRLATGQTGTEARSQYLGLSGRAKRRARGETPTSSAVGPDNKSRTVRKRGGRSTGIGAGENRDRPTG